MSDTIKANLSFVSVTASVAAFVSSTAAVAAAFTATTYRTKLTCSNYCDISQPKCANVSTYPIPVLPWGKQYMVTDVPRNPGAYTNGY